MTETPRDLPPPTNPGPTDSGPTAEALVLREVALVASALRLAGLSEIHDEDRAHRVIRDAEIYLEWLRGHEETYG